VHVNLHLRLFDVRVHSALRPRLQLPGTSCLGSKHILVASCFHHHVKSRPPPSDISLAVGQAAINISVGYEAFCFAS
jgi:hypothetical protein